MQPLKAEPFGHTAKLRPSTASLVAADGPFPWQGAIVPLRHINPTVAEEHPGVWREIPNGDATV